MHSLLFLIIFYNFLLNNHSRPSFTVIVNFRYLQIGFEHLDSQLDSLEDDLGSFDLVYTIISKLDSLSLCLTVYDGIF